MRTGQDPFNSAIQAALRVQRETRQARASGRWPGIDPNSTAGAKSLALRRAKMEETRSGRYFQNNVIEKQINKNRASLENYFQRKAAIDNQQ